MLQTIIFKNTYFGKYVQFLRFVLVYFKFKTVLKILLALRSVLFLSFFCLI